MGRVAARLADRVIVTSDNPRMERPEAIIEEILAGIPRADMARVQTQPDRRQAINEALRMAHDGDVVLIAGKGHEKYQVIGSERIEFDDVRVASEARAARFGEVA
jgi:UDP-N-acetylmuramoyl-L-alanyl-D-glutamate--2,6-diaminopimelate ligase